VKKIYIINIVVILLGVVLLLSASQDMTSYSTFGMAIDSGKRVKVVGELLKDKAMVYNPETNPNEFSFYLVDSEGQNNQVILNKAKPQDFEMSEQVVVTGIMQSGVFKADEVLMKCPSKYKDEEINLRNQG